MMKKESQLIMESIATVPYKNHTITIYPDEPFDSPNDWDNSECFLVATIGTSG